MEHGPDWGGERESYAQDAMDDLRVAWASPALVLRKLVGIGCGRVGGSGPGRTINDYFGVE